MSRRVYAKWLRKEIALLMRDGRERTSSEIAERVGANANCVVNHLKLMRKWDLVASETIGGVRHFTAWRSIVRAAK